MEQVLAENAQLRQKMQTSQDAFDARSIATRHIDDDAVTARLNDDNSTIRGPAITRRNAARSIVNGARGGIIRFAFENILEGSRVYKRTAHVHVCDQSFNSSVIRSIFTGYSLAHISILSVIAMPLCSADVSNGRHYVIQGKHDPFPDDAEDSRGDGSAPVDQQPETTTSLTHTLPTSVEFDSFAAPESFEGAEHASTPLNSLNDDIKEAYPCSSCGEVCDTADEGTMVNNTI